MYQRFSTVRILAFSVLAAYLLLGILLTGGVALPAGVILLVAVLWFSIYKFRHKDLENRELATKMYLDLEETLEGTKERVAQEEDRRRTTVEHNEQTWAERERRRVEGERRRASRPTRDPTASKYMDMLESRVREGRGTEQRPEE